MRKKINGMKGFYKTKLELNPKQYFDQIIFHYLVTKIFNYFMV